jgi:hypothetical protein
MKYKPLDCLAFGPDWKKSSIDCAKSELMALAESKTPIQSLKDDLKPGGKLELLELCLKEGTENRFTLNNYTTALVEAISSDLAQSNI